MDIQKQTRKNKLKQPKVLIFTTPTCGWCKRAMAYFRANNVKFKQVDVSRDPVAARDMQRMSGQMGVPVIKIGNQVIVGFDQQKIERLLGLKRH
jgi:glutaredoxin-like YruB-family protein